jgi:hypothetical protein
MKKFTIDLREPMPIYLRNWAAAHRAVGASWGEVEELFQTITNGRIVVVVGATTYELVFDNEAAAT